MKNNEKHIKNRGKKHCAKLSKIIHSPIFSGCHSSRIRVSRKHLRWANRSEVELLSEDWPGRSTPNSWLKFISKIHKKNTSMIRGYPYLRTPELIGKKNIYIISYNIHYVMKNSRRWLESWQNTIRTYLVGGIPTPLKNVSSSIGMIIPNIWKK